MAPYPEEISYPGWAHSTRSFASQASSKGPTGQEGPDFRPGGVIHFEIQGATFSNLLGYFRSPRLIFGFHHQAALLPLRPQSRGMLAAGGEISMGRCTTISRHLPRTQGSETQCSLCSDTIWSHSWCRASSIILG